MTQNYKTSIKNGRLSLEKCATGYVSCNILSLSETIKLGTKYVDTIFTAYKYRPNKYDGVGIIDNDELIITSNFNEYKEQVQQLVKSKQDIKMSIFDVDGTHLFTIETNGYSDVKFVFDILTYDVSLSFVSDILHIVSDVLSQRS